MGAHTVRCAAAAAMSILAAVPCVAQSIVSGDSDDAPTTASQPASAPAAAAARRGEGTSYCGRRLGSWFYCEEPAPDAATQAPALESELKAETPPEIAELEAYQKALDVAGKVASWRPTPENLERYMRLQQVASDKAGLFSDLWRRAVWATPDLDYTYKRPVAQVAKNEFDNERSSDRDVFLRGVSSQVGIFYVYSGTCGPCRVASPIIKSFADRYGVNVKVIATDGAPNPVFGPTLADQGQLQAWGIDETITPALLIYQSQTPVDRDGNLHSLTVHGSDGRVLQIRPCEPARGCLTYLGAGVMSVEDIAERAFVVLAKEPGTDF